MSSSLSFIHFKWGASVTLFRQTPSMGYSFPMLTSSINTLPVYSSSSKAKLVPLPKDTHLGWRGLIFENILFSCWELSSKIDIIGMYTACLVIQRKQREAKMNSKGWVQVVYLLVPMHMLCTFLRLTSTAQHTNTIKRRHLCMFFARNQQILLQFHKKKNADNDVFLFSLLVAHYI